MDMILSQSSHLLYSKPVSLKYILFYLTNFSAFHAEIFHRSPHHNSICILYFQILCTCPPPQLPYTVLANSVVQGLIWKAHSSTAYQKIPCFYGISKILHVTYHPYIVFMRKNIIETAVSLYHTLCRKLSDSTMYFLVETFLKLNIPFTLWTGKYFHILDILYCHQSTLACFSGTSKYM